eukprot:CAMPEP_0201694440 /NCGR_PEP_ID=MMETSP0578-20130828/6716_1 /ASSEMBLY_ACC=CAM_ASM_000663 /TAXON_ID=267565 /ORGANISM="Skeletonema grethea, Strain CCMP 1804" /LENGTH=278 /DNA_ID=CAMNT_0048180127 /DNA_START=66 /DNA_END=902 /DNA_ORIENTATION=-
MSSGRPTKKSKKSSGSAAGSSSAIDDLTALTTAQLYSLSAKRHRDYSREIVRLAQEERDRAHVAVQEMQRRLERANEHLEKMGENASDAHREYLDAKNLLIRVRQSTGASVPPMNIALDDSSVEDILGIISKKKDSNTNNGKSPGRKSQKFPYIEDILVSLARSGELHKGTKLSSTECNLVNKKDNSQYVYTMQLVEELWTEEEELFLRSSSEEIEESLEEATIIAETISLRCLTKLNEFEGREDPTPTNHQKPSFVSVGNRARRVFVGRKKGDENLV